MKQLVTFLGNPGHIFILSWEKVIFLKNVLGTFQNLNFCMLEWFSIIVCVSSKFFPVLRSMYSVIFLSKTVLQKCEIVLQLTKDSVLKQYVKTE